MLRMTFVLVAAIAGISCERRPRTAAVPPAGGTPVQSDSAETRLHHPAEHPLRAVPILIGMPTTEMQETVRQGKALLGSCIGPPDPPPQANVCEQCRLWKTDEMKYWQPLPKEFGELAATNGG